MKQIFNPITTKLYGLLGLYKRTALLAVMACLLALPAFSKPVSTNNALNLDGTDDYVTTAPYPGSNLTGNLTIECWIYRTPGNNTNAILSRNSTGEIQLYSLGNTTSQIFLNGGSVYSYQFAVNTWYHIAIVRDSTNSKTYFYVNGTMVQSTGYYNPGITAQNSPLDIGREVNAFSGNSSYFFSGSIDDLRIWKTARTPSEILNNYNIELSGNEPNLIAYYNFNQGVPGATNSGVTTLNDAVAANPHNATLTNFALTGTSSNWIGGGFTPQSSPGCFNTGDINIQGNGINIPSGSTSVSASNNTFIGTAIGASKTFNIQNLGSGPLAIGAAISSQTSFNTSISGSTLTISSVNSSYQTSVITVYSNDCDEILYTFTVAGGTCSANFNSCPGNVSATAAAGNCSQTVTYSATAQPGNITYSFSGATTGSGNGTGSGSVFNAGVTTVTLTNTAACGSTSICMINVTVNASGLTWYLDADNDGHYTGSPVTQCTNPGAGYNTTSNIAGDCNDNDPAVYAGCPGEALNFDGSNDYIELANQTNFDFSTTQPFTIETKVKSSSTSDGWLFTKFAAPLRGFGFLLKGNGLLAALVNDFNIGKAIVVGTSTPLNNNAWHHVAVTYDGSATAAGFKFYVDGVLQASSAQVDNLTGADAINNTVNPWIGKANGLNGMFQGNMDEMRVWSKALTQAEVQFAMNCEITVTGGNLLANYHFNQGVAAVSNTGISTLTDASGNNNSGTLNNFALTGSSSNWSAPGAVVSGVSCNCTATNWYRDFDNDTYGDAGNMQSSCIQPSGYVSSNTDCNDNNAAINPATLWYLDADNDTYYTGAGIAQCSSPGAGYKYTGLTAAGDCNDASATVYPGATEICGNGIDDNCNGQTDENCAGLTITWTGTTNTNWNIPTNWSPNTVPGALDSVIIPLRPNQPAISANTSIGSINFAANVTVTLNNATLNFSSTISGNTNAKITGNGYVVATGSNAKLTNALVVNNLRVTGIFTLINVAATKLNIINTVEINGGTLNSNGKLYLKSTATGTASIATITSGSITGDVTQERYIPAGPIAYEYFASGVANQTMNSLKDDITTTFGNPASVQYYTESMPGNMTTNGWTSFASNGAIPAHRGFSAYMYSKPKTLDLTGPAYQGVQNIPVTYTNSGSITDDGYNLVANPYISDIDWASSTGWTRTNIDPVIYILNPVTNNNVSYNYSTGIGTGGFNGKIANGQSFFVKTNAPSPALIIDETAKTNGAVFYKQDETLTSYLRMKIAGEAGNGDEVVFGLSNDATEGYDAALDAPKLNNNYVDLALIGKNGEKLSQQFLNDLADKSIIPVSFNTNSETGKFIISFEQASNISATIYLRDNLLGALTEITDNTTYEFEVTDANAANNENRFDLLIGKEAAKSTIEQLNLSVFPNPAANGFSYAVSGLANSAQLTITDVLGNTVYEQNEISNNRYIVNSSNWLSGVYFVEIQSTNNKIVQRLVINK